MRPDGVVAAQLVKVHQAELGSWFQLCPGRRVVEGGSGVMVVLLYNGTIVCGC